VKRFFLALAVVALFLAGCAQVEVMQNASTNATQENASLVANESKNQTRPQEELMSLVDAGEPFDCDYFVSGNESYHYQARFGRIRVEGKQGFLRAVAVYQLLSHKRFSKAIIPSKAVAVQDCAWVVSQQDYAGFKSLVLSSPNGTLSCREPMFSEEIFEPQGRLCTVQEWDAKMQETCGKLGEKKQACVDSIRQKGYYAA